MGPDDGRRDVLCDLSHGAYQPLCFPVYVGTVTVGGKIRLNCILVLNILAWSCIVVDFLQTFAFFSTQYPNMSFPADSPQKADDITRSKSSNTFLAYSCNRFLICCY